MTRAGLAALVVVALLVIGAIVFGGPFVSYWKQRTANAEAGRERALDDTVGRGLETEGTEVLAAADGQDRETVVIIRESAHALEVESRSDVSAASPLPDSVLDRLGAGDRVLCDSGVECRPGGRGAEPRATGQGEGGLPGLDD